MSLNQVAAGDRTHIGFFGLRNAGKSSVVNAVTGQSLSVVSDVKGTTTDPVMKAMELLPLGPVMIIDTPGLDDEGELGLLRVKKAKEILAKVNIAVLVSDAANDLSNLETALIDVFKERKIPYVIALNKADISKKRGPAPGNVVYTSALTGEGINELKEKIGSLAQKGEEKKIVADLLSEGDKVLLITPIDKAAPKGRLILPQQQTIREIVEASCTALVCNEKEIESTLSALKEPPRMVITDSQVFRTVEAAIPKDVPLTSFSILFARYKGDLEELVRGAAALSSLKDGDKVLISEGCTHHRQCNDIGTVKMPFWIEGFSKAKLLFSFTSGGDFPEDLSEYKAVVHCGGCMLTEQEMKNRIARTVKQNIPIVNYGIAIAHMNGILKRSLEVFPNILNIL